MPGQVVKVSLLRHYKEAGHGLPIDEQKAKIEQVEGLRKACGGRLLVHARAHWASGELYAFSAEVFPEIDAVQKYTEALEKMEWFRYVESESFLGIPQLINEPVYTKGILQLQVIRGMKEPAYQTVMGKATANLVLDQIGANFDKLGGRRILRMACRWSREDVWSVQLLEWPDLDALRKHVEYEDLLNWSLVVDQQHYLGIPG